MLGAAAEDLYDMKDFVLARTSAQKLIDAFPTATPAIRRTAWIVVAHSSFDLAEYPQAEQAYAHVLEVTPQEDESRAALVENLAASIYKQGEQANALGEYRAAADHFLRIKVAAADVEDPRRRRVRRGCGADAPAGLDGRRRSAR